MLKLHIALLAKLAEVGISSLVLLNCSYRSYHFELNGLNMFFITYIPHREIAYSEAYICFDTITSCLLVWMVLDYAMVARASLG